MLFDKLFLTVSIVPNAAPVASNVSITGTPVVGEILGVTFDYSDAESDLEGAHVYNWWMADTQEGEYAAIALDESTVLLTEAYSDKWIKVSVTPVALTGTSPGTEVFSSAVQVGAFLFSFDFSYADNSSYLVLI